MADKPRVRVPALRAFDAGKSGRRLRSIPTSTQAINAQIRFYGATILARSRYLTNNNPYAAAAKESFIAALVGDGIVPAPLLQDEPDLKEQIQQAFLAWTDEADADWLTDFYGMQALIAAEMFEAGECFVRIRQRRPDDPGSGPGQAPLLVPMQLQLIPAEMLPHTDNRDTRAAGAARVEMGIEFDAIGRRVAYHFLREHPGNPRAGFIRPDLTTRVPAEEVLHLFRPTVAGQIRGVPHTISAVAKLAMMDQYDDAELERKRSAALFGGFITREAAVDEEGEVPLPGVLDGADPLGAGLEPGAFVPLEPGEDVKFSEPADVGGNYEVFQYRTLLAIASGFGVPYSSMTGDLRQTSYSSIRAGLVEFRRRVEALQHHVMVYQFCRPVWQRWFADAALAGAFPIDLGRLMRPLEKRRLMAAEWIPPHWEWVDPLDDLKAEKLAVDNGFKARSDVIKANGYDPEEVDRRIRSDRERAESLGITFPGTDPERASRPVPNQGEANAGHQRRGGAGPVVVPGPGGGRR